MGAWGAGLAMGYVLESLLVREFQIEVSVVGDFSGSNDRDFYR
jgi:hypothetical protein